MCHCIDRCECGIVLIGVNVWHCIDRCKCVALY